MIEAWAWPQWCIIALFALGMFVAVVEHGKPRTSHNAYWRALDVIVFSLLLWYGGFFS
jgi:hypothetical protein